jgi:GC-rich sequence DNA-binding factor
MSDNPVIFKRSSKAKLGQRARQKSPDANDTPSDFTSQTGDESPITLASKLKDKAKRSKPKSRLSFGGDDDTEVCVFTDSGELVLIIRGLEGDGVFQVKKSNLSQKLKLGAYPASPAYVLPLLCWLIVLVLIELLRNLPMSLDQANISNGAPSYSAAYLSELKASTPSSRRPPINDPYDADMSMDVDDISVDSVYVFGIPAYFFPICTPNNLYFLAADNDTAIPSESSILNAKQRRERLRATTASNGDDYISLSVITRSDESRGPHPDSRLVREEDELGEGDDGM